MIKHKQELQDLKSRSIYGEIKGGETIFRYAFTAHLAWNRCHPKVIQMLRGDADATMLDRYTQFTSEQVRQEYLRAIPKLGI